MERSKTMIGTRIKQARIAAGLAPCDLADQCDLSVVTISRYEDDVMTPSSDVLATLARLLGVRVEYFLRQRKAKLVEVSCRKPFDLSEQEKERSLAAAQIQLERWLALEEFILTRWSIHFRIDELPTKISSLSGIETAAETVRAAWKLGHAPIPRLIDTLELHGIQVFTTTHDDEQKLAGLSAKANDKPAIIIVGGKHAPGDRRRYTLAYELGHLILNGRLARTVEKERACHRFAGAFLIPADALIEQLGRSRNWIEPRELQLIKEAWGVSMAAVMLRARALGVITPNTAAKMWQRFEDNGWDKREPDPQYECETPRGFEQLVYRALAEDKVSEAKAAELLGLTSMLEVSRREANPADS